MKSILMIIVFTLFSANAIATWETLLGQAPASEDNPTTVEKVELGKMLFIGRAS